MKSGSFGAGPRRSFAPLCGAVPGPGEEFGGGRQVGGEGDAFGAAQCHGVQHLVVVQVTQGEGGGRLGVGSGEGVGGAVRLEDAEGPAGMLDDNLDARVAVHVGGEQIDGRLPQGLPPEGGCPNGSGPGLRGVCGHQQVGGPIAIQVGAGEPGRFPGRFFEGRGPQGVAGVRTRA